MTKAEQDKIERARWADQVLYVDVETGIVSSKPRHISVPKSYFKISMEQAIALDSGESLSSLVPGASRFVEDKAIAEAEIAEARLAEAEAKKATEEAEALVKANATAAAEATARAESEAAARGVLEKELEALKKEAKDAATEVKKEAAKAAATEVKKEATKAAAKPKK